MIVAIPQYKNDIAPCFEAAGHFLIAVIEAGRKVSTCLMDCGGLAGIKRIQMLRDHGVETLICGGIKGNFRCMLEAAGIKVISDIECSAGEALDKFLSGDLVGSVSSAPVMDESEEILLEELITWAKKHFEKRGFRVKCGSEAGPFPIDLIAELPCPVCHRPVRVAVCCGAHMYRADREVREFHHAAGTDYHWRVYVRRITPHLADCCREYGIEMIDPASGQVETPPDRNFSVFSLSRLLMNRDWARPEQGR